MEGLVGRAALLPGWRAPVTRSRFLPIGETVRVIHGTIERTDAGMVVVFTPFAWRNVDSDFCQSAAEDPPPRPQKANTCSIEHERELGH